MKSNLHEQNSPNWMEQLEKFIIEKNLSRMNVKNVKRKKIVEIVSQFYALACLPACRGLALALALDLFSVERRAIDRKHHTQKIQLSRLET